MFYHFFMGTGSTSQHFGDHELACHHCGVNGCTAELVGALEQLRSYLSQARGVDTPILVDDAYRCAVKNASLANAARGSQHVLGNAADIRVNGLSAIDLYRYVVKIPDFRGIGRDDHKQYVHVDVREEPARWCYSESGGTIAWTEPPAADVLA